MNKGGEKIMEQITLETPVSNILEELSAQSKIYSEPFLIESLEKLRDYNPLPYEEKRIDELTRFFVDRWFSQRMRKRYAELSPEIFELRRKMEIDTTNLKAITRRGDYVEMEGSFTCEIPVLVEAELEDEFGWKGEFTYEDWRNNTYEFYLSSRMPKVPSEVRKAGKEAVAYSYETYADAIRTDVLSNIIEDNPEYAPHPENSKLIVLWKPRPSDIHIEAKLVDKDPVLLLRYGKPYLVSAWREPNEEPIMHILSACKLDSFLE